MELSTRCPLSGDASDTDDSGSGFNGEDSKEYSRRLSARRVR